MEIFMIIVVILLIIIVSYISYCFGYVKGFNKSKEIDDNIINELKEKYNLK